MRVVVALDGSKYSRWALEWVGHLPFAEPPQLVAVHAVDTGALRAPFMVQPPVLSNEAFIRTEIKRLESHGQQIRAEAEQTLAGMGVKGRVRVERGAVSPTILKQAVRGSLVVVGHRGLSALDRFFLGSVSERVAQHAPCSVLVVKQAPRPLTRVLLATDGSRAAAKALQFVLRAFRAEGGVEVSVIHVMPYLEYPERREPGNALLTRYSERLTAAGFLVREVPELGNPAEQILKTAEQRKGDLIIAGAKGLGAVARFFLGSVSTKLIQHAPCSVLVVR